MSSSDSSAGSPSPSPSPEASAHVQGPPGLHRLVVHFVSAKRSLNSTSHVYRANELVSNSRSLVEEIATLNAVNSFGRRGLNEQSDSLHVIRDALVSDGNKVTHEFEAQLAALDQSHVRLETTLESLRKTIIDSSLQLAKKTPFQSPQNEAHSEAGGTNSELNDDHTLYDFIDEATHEDLLNSLRSLIDSYHFARADLDNNLKEFESALTTISDFLAGNAENPGPPDKPTIYDEPPPSIPQLFRGMEENATEMATLLENLVNHYDLCVTALKHTEGGGQAAKRAIVNEDLTEKIPVTEESLYRKTAAEPIPEEERAGLLEVLEKDALEVEEVNTEIRDRAAEMEEQYGQLSKHASQARKDNKMLRHVLELLHRLRAAIPLHLEAVSTLRGQWDDIRSSLQTKTDEVGDLADFYENFLSGYGKLLQEIVRRKATEAQMQRVAEKARREFERLYEADRMEREEFFREVGDYLPKDIWHGLADDAPRWEIRVVPRLEKDGANC